VFGGTGTQGTSVVNALLAKKDKYNVRVMTRNTQSPKAEELKKLGCEVVPGSFQSHEELVKAMDGCYGIFLVTDFWQPPFTQEAEVLQGRLVSNAVLEVNEKNPNQIKIVVFSSLPGPFKASNGKNPVPHLDSKAEILAEMVSRKIPVSGIGLAYYMQNYDGVFSALVKVDDSNYVVKYPLPLDNRLPLVDVDQYGLVVVEAFENPDIWLGRDFLVVSDCLTVREIVDALSELLGKTVKKSDESYEQYAKGPFPSVELAKMYKFMAEHPDLLSQDLEETNHIVGKSTTFKEYLVKKSTWKKW